MKVKKGSYIEEQIVDVIKPTKAGLPMKGLCRLGHDLVPPSGIEPKSDA